LFGGRVELDAGFDVLAEVTHEVDAANRIGTLVEDDGGGNPAATAFVHDLNGNLIFDGRYVYQYDAWNRLIAVNEAGTLTADDFDSDGRIAPAQGHAIGSL